MQVLTDNRRLNRSLKLVECMMRSQTIIRQFIQLYRWLFHKLKYKGRIDLNDRARAKIRGLKYLHDQSTIHQWELFTHSIPYRWSDSSVLLRLFAFGNRRVLELNKSTALPLVKSLFVPLIHRFYEAQIYISWIVWSFLVRCWPASSIYLHSGCERSFSELRWVGEPCVYSFYVLLWR